MTSEPMSLSELREAIKGHPGSADVQVHLPGGRTFDISEISFTPADPGSVVDADASLNIWLETPDRSCLVTGHQCQAANLSIATANRCRDCGRVLP